MRNYDDFLKHVYKHHRKDKYKCQFEGCKHKITYKSLDELAEHHWEKDCQHFSDIYKICKNCEKQIDDNVPHDCIGNLKS